MIAKIPSPEAKPRRPAAVAARWVAAATLLALAGAGCGRRDAPGPASTDPRLDLPAAGGISSKPLRAAAAADGPLFTELAGEQTGIAFANRWNPAGRQAEELTGPFAGGGVAIGDCDGDGLPDLYLTRPIGGSRLYRNLGNWRFEDVTRAAGLEDAGLHGAGASFADLDNDGDLDLHVCCYDGPNRAYINRGDGSFVDRATEMGLDLQRASVMCAFADYDNDGDLDGYLLTNSRPPKAPLQIRPIEEDGRWTVPAEAREHKAVIVRDEVKLFYIDAGERDHLLRNNGDGTFTDVSAPAGIEGYDIGLSATWLDANADGAPDLYVANDFFTPDRLWLNNGDGTFRDVIAEALPHTPWYSMGSDVADINNDGLFDLIATDMAATSHYKSKVTMGNMQDNWFLEYPTPRQYMRNAVYLNTGTPRWMEVAHMAGLANTDWTWAVKFADLDTDGFVDLFVANGMTRIWFHSDLRQQLTREVGGQVQMALDDWLRTPMQSEPNLAYRNLGELRFESVGPDWGLDKKGVSFGAAMGDLDGDGDLDLAVNNFEAPVSVYRNNSAGGHRLALRLRGVESNRFGLGATVRIETSAGIQVRYLSPHTGFYSSSEPLVHFGLGAEDSVARLTVDWPSGRRQSFEKLAADQLYTIAEAHGGTIQPRPAQPVEPMFAGSEALAKVEHRETPFDDFQRQPLLPNRLSQLGPGMAWGDVDGDGDEDLFLSGAKGQPGQLLLRDEGGGFRAATAVAALAADADREDMSALFLDAEGDGDLDLFVVSGGVECEPGDESLRDRLYLNDGTGGFTAAPAGTLPDLRDSGGAAVAADFDRDGDLDLFVGGRSVPGRYPLSPKSRLLRNDSIADGGAPGTPRFTDATAELAGGLLETGMITAALWSDADGDGWLDLLTAAEWGPVRLWRNEQGVLQDATAAANLSDRLGWWNGIAGGDVDRDGDIDYVVTNFGLNTKYRASPEAPALLYYGDFEGGGQPRLVEAKSYGDQLLPIRGKSCSTGAMPFLADRFPTFHSFASSALPDIYTPQRLDEARRFSANELRSGLLVNDGAGRFEFRALPRLAQASPAFGAALNDIDGDGDLDLYLAQNFFGPQAETGRMAGGLSLLLAGDGGGAFEPVWPRESGLVVPGDARSLATTDLDGDGWVDFVVGINDASPVAFRNGGAERAAEGTRMLAVRLAGPPANPLAVGARVRLRHADGAVQTAEVHAGGGYLSQSTAALTFGIPPQAKVEGIEVRWPDGTTSEHPAPGGADREISIRKPGA